MQVLRFSLYLVRLFVKKLKKFHKKNIFFIILLAIILLPLKYQFWSMAKLRQFSHFLQQINKSAFLTIRHKLKTVTYYTYQLDLTGNECALLEKL